MTCSLAISYMDYLHNGRADKDGVVPRAMRQFRITCRVYFQAAVQFRGVSDIMSLKVLTDLRAKIQ